MLESRIVLLTWTVSVAAAFCCQQNVTAQAPAKAPSKAPPVLLEKGVVEDNTYKNKSLGLEFNPAPGLKFGNPEIKGPPDSAPQIVTVSAWRERKPLSVREGTIFYADLTFHYSENQRSTDSYLQKVVRANENDGYELMKGTSETHVGRIPFARADFRKAEVYEVVLVKACNAFTSVFIFAGPDLERVNQIVSQTVIKLDPQSSGCGTGEADAPQSK